MSVLATATTVLAPVAVADTGKPDPTEAVIDSLQGLNGIEWGADEAAAGVKTALRSITGAVLSVSDDGVVVVPIPVEG